MMKQWFHFGKDLGHFLFKGVYIDEWRYLAAAMVVVAVVAILIELIKTLMAHIRRKITANPLTEAQSENRTVNSHSPLLSSLRIPPTVQHIKRRRLKLHMTNSLLHLLEVIVGYLLMLAIMSYNSYIFLSVLFGLGVGYFLFGFYREGSIQSSTTPQDLQDSDRRGVEHEDEEQHHSEVHVHTGSYGAVDT